MEKKKARSTPLVTITCCLFLIPLIYLALFAASDRWTIWFPNTLEDAETMTGRDSINRLLGRLVRGDDRNKLETSRFACDSAPHSVICVAIEHVRIEPANLKVQVPFYNQTEPQIETLVKPYARQEDNNLMRLITPVRILQENITVTPESCYYTHKVPVIIFSSGLIGNLYHEISEIIIPLFITSGHFQKSVQFMVTDYHPWFVQKYGSVLTQLSRYKVIDTSTNTSVHCFPGAVIGLKYHDNLALDPNSIPGGYTMLNFKQFLRKTYNLEFKNANDIKKPVLLLISRKASRTFLNEDAMVDIMEKMGFQVIVPETGEMMNLDKFSQVVNSCNVMVGAHGAGLTNEIFLPQGAVVVQVVPYALTWASDTYYAHPASKMGLKYLEYKTVAEESSLIDTYGPDSTVITDPESLFSKGYQAVKPIYMDGQNMTINLTRFRATLVQALVHLRYPYPPN